MIYTDYLFHKLTRTFSEPVSNMSRMKYEDGLNHRSKKDFDVYSIKTTPAVVLEH